MRFDDLVQRLSNGIAKLFIKDEELFDLGAKGINEQTLTFRLGLYLAEEFPDHHVDCEYNRLWDGTKRCVRFRIKWMKPDVIVHIRRCDKANMVCVEAKKAIYWKYVDKVPRDVRRKLRALTYPTAEYGSNALRCNPPSNLVLARSQSGNAPSGSSITVNYKHVEHHRT